MKSKMTLKEVFGLSERKKTLNSPSQLRNVILQEIRSVLREEADPGKVDTDRFPTNLSQVATDPEKAQQLVNTGADGVDKGSADDVIGASGASFATGDLKPSQSSMNIEKALSMALGMIRDDSPGGDLGAFISSDNHIMDGHHRWVATSMVDPSAQIGGYAVDFPADKLIPVLNALTVGKFGKTQGKEGTGGFDQFQEGPIRAQLEAYLDKGAWKMAPEEVQATIEKFTEKSGEEAVDAAVAKFVDNLSGISFDLPGGAPARPDMPVIDEPDVPVALAALTGGEVDVNEPYGDPESLAAGKDMGDDIVLERWRKMAGLLNG